MPSPLAIRALALGFLLAAAAPVARAQDADAGTPHPDRAATPAELLERLRKAGVELPEGIVVNEDGTVSVPVPPAEQAAEQAEGRPGAQDAEDPQPVPGPPASTDTAVQDPAPDEAAPAGRPAAEWKRRVELSLGLSDGNSEESDFRVAGRLTRKTPRDDLRINAQFYFATANGQETNNEFFATTRYDRTFKSHPRVLSFAEGRYDYNEFESFLHRTNVSSGAGYKLIDREKLGLIIRGGAALTKEFDSPRNEIIPEALLGFDLDWDLTDQQSLTVSHRTFIDLTEIGEFRLLSNGAWELALDDVAQGLLFSLGVQHEYQTAVAADIRRSDINVFASLGLDF